MKQFIPIIALYIIIVLLLSCSEDDVYIADNIDVTSEIRLNTLYNLKEIQDGYIISGIEDSKVTIIKLDVNFNIVWRKNDFEWGNIYDEGGWGGSFYSVDIVNILQKANGDLVCFCSITYGGCVMLQKSLIVILDKRGNEIRSKELEHYGLINATITSDKGYLLFGNSLVKLDSDFSKVSENIDLNYITSGAFITKTIDNGIAVTGTWNSEQVFLQKLDEKGNIQWENKNFNQKAFNDLGYDILQMTNDEFIIIGRTRNIKEPWDMDCFMIRTNNIGDTIWTKKFGMESDEWLEKFIYTSDDNFIIKEIIGFPSNPNRKAGLLKISESGEIIESKEIGISDEFIYTTTGYFLKAEKKGDNILSLTKVQFDNLFD